MRRPGFGDPRPTLCRRHHCTAVAEVDATTISAAEVACVAETNAAAAAAATGTVGVTPNAAVGAAVAGAARTERPLDTQPFATYADAIAAVRAAAAAAAANVAVAVATAADATVATEVAEAVTIASPTPPPLLPMPPALPPPPFPRQPNPESPPHQQPLAVFNPADHLEADVVMAEPRSGQRRRCRGATTRSASTRPDGAAPICAPRAIAVVPSASEGSRLIEPLSPWPRPGTHRRPAPPMLNRPLPAQGMQTRSQPGDKAPAARQQRDCQGASLRSAATAMLTVSARPRTTPAAGSTHRMLRPLPGGAGRHAHDV